MGCVRRRSLPPGRLHRATVWASSGVFGGLLLRAQALATTLMETEVANASLAALYGFFTLLCIITPKLVQYIGPK